MTFYIAHQITPRAEACSLLAPEVEYSSNDLVTKLS